MLEDPMNVILIIIFVMILIMLEMNLVALATVAASLIYDHYEDLERFSSDELDEGGNEDDDLFKNPVPTEQQEMYTSQYDGIAIPPIEALNFNNIDKYAHAYENYKGNINYGERLKLHPHNLNDRLTESQLNVQGADYKRQLVGTKNRKNYLKRFIYNDIVCDETRPWWEYYDL